MRLRKVLLNLVANAIKYNRVNGKVSLECEKTSNDKISFKVKDTGFGISRNKHEGLFKAFCRLGNGPAANEGTGMGLNDSEGLVDLVGGTIKVDSVVGGRERVLLLFCQKEKDRRIIKEKNL